MVTVMRIAFAFLLALLASPGRAEDRFITLGSTTSTRDSGLLDDLLPRFKAKSGVDVHVVAVGSGQAFVLGRKGDVDVLLVHDRPAEEEFVADGSGIDRRDVMYNDFVLVGPHADAARVRGLHDAPAAFAKIAAAQVPFASRGDGSGTHQAEKRLWKLAAIEPAGAWYRETGSGMGATLNTAAGMDAYALADRATWDTFANRADLELLVEGDVRLRNPYSVILVNPARQPHVKVDDARRFADWLVSADGQAAIGAFQKNGKPLFVPDAKR
jgi:tungstate transport system substrate-binding protein